MKPEGTAETDAKSERPDATSAGARRPREQLKMLLLAAGVEVLHARGLSLSAHEITYKEVFDHLEETQGIRVTRGSVHERIWASQREFQLAVLTEAARYDVSPELDSFVADRADVFDRADLTTAAGRAATLGEFMRLFGMSVSDMLDNSLDWEFFIGSWTLAALARSTPQDDAAARALTEVLLESYSQITAAYTELGEGLFEALMQTPDPRVVSTEAEAVWILCRLSMALADGLTLRRRVDPTIGETLRLPTGTAGELQEWDLFGVGLHLLCRGLFDRDPQPDDIS